MQRIDKDRIATFFRTHPDIKPVRGYFVEHHDGPEDEDREIIRCCGLTAAMLADEEGHGCSREFTTTDLADSGFTEGVDMLATTLELDPQYARGFADGWDRKCYDDSSEYMEGYADGSDAWDAVRDLA